MIRFLYDIILFLSYCIVSFFKPHHLKKFFPPIPNPRGKDVFWIHAVSVGEVKAAKTLFHLLREHFPSHFLFVTTTTMTGLAEACRSLSAADAFGYLPIDLSFLSRRFVKKLDPKLFVMVESDFWPNLLFSLKKSGCKIAVVSGKLSERSKLRFSKFSFFSKKIFSNIDLIIAQNEEHFHRFSSLISAERLQIGGNLKFDHSPDPVDLSLWRYLLSTSDPAITLSCTHAPEERDILELLPFEHLFVFLAPRHPERFEEVAMLLKKKKIPFFRWSRFKERRGDERVLLVDAMGQLPICYSLSRLAIVAGSFHPKVGGHNLLEPCFYGTPVLFGPHVFAQTELANRLLTTKAGLQVTYKTLRSTLENILQNPLRQEEMRKAATALVRSCQGASEKTFNLLKHLCINH